MSVLTQCYCLKTPKTSMSFAENCYLYHHVIYGNFNKNEVTGLRAEVQDTKWETKDRFHKLQNVTFISKSFYTHTSKSGC